MRRTVELVYNDAAFVRKSPIELKRLFVLTEPEWPYDNRSSTLVTDAFVLLGGADS